MSQDERAASGIGESRMTPEPDERGPVASCCLPGGVCHQAGLADIQHRVEPPPGTIWVVFSDTGANIRKWSTKPFDGGIEYVADYIAIPRLKLGKQDLGDLED